MLPVMKKAIFFMVIFIACSSANAQIFWLNDLARAKEISASSGKLMVLDFWADWCKPCKNMERELWNNPEMKTLSSNFIGVKIDVDFNKSIAMNYSAQAIPKVVVALPSGEAIWENVGFSSADIYLKVLRALPDNLSLLFEDLNLIKEKEKDPVPYFDAGKEFQKVAKNITDENLQNKFLIQSAFYFRKADKFSNDPKFKQQIGLYSLLNDVYGGNPKKAMKSFQKAGFNKEDKEISELSHFILASCYKALNDNENFTKEKGFITKDEFLNQLDEK
jgi:thiol-disulfide isomerase/thioredoxin